VIKERASSDRQESLEIDRDLKMQQRK